MDIEQKPLIRVLVVEEDPSDRAALERVLREKMTNVEGVFASSIAEAKSHLLAHEYDVVIAGIKFSDGTAFDLFHFPSKAPVIVIASTGNEETAIRAMKAGAQDYLVKDSAGAYLHLLPVRIEAATRTRGVEAQAQLLARALLRTNHAVFLTDLQGMILFTNETFRRQYGYSSVEILGKTTSLLGEISPEGLQLHKRKDGTTFPVFLHTTILKDDRETEVAMLYFSYPERIGQNGTEEETREHDSSSLEARMTEALTSEEFLLHYQPIFHLTDGKMTSLESLLRWKNPRFGLVMPIQFVPSLERSGFIVQVGEWVLHKVCQQLHDWQRQHFELVPVTVNLSHMQFLDPNLISLTEGLLREFSLSREAIVMEIKETSLLFDPNTARQILIDLQRHGLNVCLDNATGALDDSLSQYPMKMLKLDVSLVQGLESKKAVTQQVKRILAAAHALKMITIAKGVETREQQEALVQMGCQMGQGFLYQLPLPVRDLERVLEAEKKKEEKAKNAPIRVPGGILP